MAVKIAQNHPVFLLKSKVQEASHSLLTTFGFNYFQYLRCFADGSVSGLTNDTGLFEFFQHVEDQPYVYSSFAKEHAQAHSYWFLWDEALPQMPVQLAREKFNFHNGVTLGAVDISFLA